MRLLAVADEEDKGLWDYYSRDKLQGAELILACGDLDYRYLEFLATMAAVPVFYVHGNHDECYDTHPPEGVTCLDDRVVVYNGLRIAGLGENEIKACLANEAMSNAVLNDYRMGEAMGVNSTPTLFINGQLYRGSRSVEELDSVFGKAAK